MRNNILNKKIQINKKLVSLILFFSVLILSHLLISSLRFVYQEYNIFSSIRNGTKNYMVKHEKELKDEVFDKLFKESENCNQVNNIDLRKKCSQNISYTLALIIKEEEFPYWPHDLFFVKKTNNNFFKLGWDGELKARTTLSNNNVLNNKESTFSDFIFRRCDYFGATNIPARSCEIYEKIQLNNNEDGYIVRNIGLTETDYFIFYLLMPYFILFGTLSSLSSFSLPSEFGFYIELFIGLIPFVIGFIAVYLVNKKGKKIK